MDLAQSFSQRETGKAVRTLTALLEGAKQFAPPTASAIARASGRLGALSLPTATGPRAKTKATGKMMAAIERHKLHGSVATLGDSWLPAMALGPLARPVKELLAKATTSIANDAHARELLRLIGVEDEVQILALLTQLQFLPEFVGKQQAGILGWLSGGYFEAYVRNTDAYAASERVAEELFALLRRDPRHARFTELVHDRGVIRDDFGLLSDGMSYARTKDGEILPLVIREIKKVSVVDKMYAQFDHTIDRLFSGNPIHLSDRSIGRVRIGRAGAPRLLHGFAEGVASELRQTPSGALVERFGVPMSKARELADLLLLYMRGVGLSVRAARDR